MNVRMFLARLSGARPDILRRAPGDVTRHAAMGGVLLSTSMVAAVSAFFALTSTLHLSWQVSALIAAGWAVVIFNLDRMLIVTMTGLKTVGLKLGAAVPRLLLAVVIGAVISTPLVLKIFEPEVNAQLTIMHAQQIAQAKTELDKTYADITQLKSEQATLQATISGQTIPAVTDDADVKAAEANYQTAQTTFQQLSNQAQCELNGTCGSGHVGQGPAYLAAKAQADDAQRARDAAKTALDTAKAKAASRLGNAAQVQAADAAKRLPAVQAQLAVEQQRQQDAQTQATTADNHDDGLLARLEALDQVTSGQPMASLAHLMLFLLFLSIEILPVLTKLLSSFGTATLYDRLVERDDEKADAADGIQAQVERDMAQVAADHRLTLARDQADGQLQAGRVAVQALVDTQTKIALKAVAVWAQLATARSDEQINQWYQTHVAPVTNGRPGPAVPWTELTVPIPAVPASAAVNGNTRS
jgi:hypothetical protein